MVPPEIQFWGARDELSIEEGLFMKGNHICIPQNSMIGHCMSYTIHIWELKKCNTELEPHYIGLG